MAVTGAIRRKRVDDPGPPDVAGMNDVVDARQAKFRLRP
jgi:hypothetical protein